jgi:hypothetical protein
MASNDATNANLPADRAMAALSLAYFLEGTHLREIGIIHAVLDGQIKKKLSSPYIENIPLSPSGKSPVEARPIPAREEGRIAIVTDVGQGMRWTRQRRRAQGTAGRVSMARER